MAIEWTVLLLILRLLYSILMIVATLSLIAFTFVLIWGWSKFREVPFYMIIWSLTIADLLHMILQWLIIYPSLFIEIQENRFLYALQESIVGQCGLTLTDQAQIVFVALISLNRFAVFVAHPLEVIFTRRTMPLTILFTLPILIALVWLRTMVRLAERDNQDVVGYKIVMTFIHNGVPAINLLLYVLIYLRLRQQRREGRSVIRVSDRGLLVQAFLEALMLEMTKLIDLIPYQLGDQSIIGLFGLTFKTIASVSSHSFNSLSFLFFNSTVRGVVRTIPFVKSFLNRTSNRPSSVSNLNIKVPNTLFLSNINCEANK